MRILVFGIVVASGCWSDHPPRPAVPVASPVASEHTRESPIRRATLPHVNLPPHTVWSGTYVCSQGLTGVTLTIDLVGTAASVLFEFAAVPQNSNPVPSGASRLIGAITENVDGGLSIDADPDEWVSQPPGYFMVGIAATTDGSMREMHGTMKSQSCGRIDVTRDR
jgi:hypothetical protein